MDLLQHGNEAWGSRNPALMIAPDRHSALLAGPVHQRGFEICDFLFNVAQDLGLDPPKRMKAITE
jgi:hypothetical protein